MATIDTIDTLISNAIADANTRVAKVDYWADAAFYKPGVVSKSDSRQFPDLILPTLNSVGTQIVPVLSFPASVQIPNITMPKGDSVYGDDIIDIIDSLNKFSTSFAINTIGPRLTQYFSDFFTRYYPKFADEKYGPQQVFDILNQVTPTKAIGFAMPESAEDAIFQRGRSVILTRAGKQEADVVGEWAKRGFQTPPGMMFGQQLAVRQQAQSEIAQAASDIALKQEEISIQTYLFGIEQALAYREKALDNAVDYLRVFTTTVLKRFDASAYAAILEARNRLYSTTMEMYKTANATRQMGIELNQGNRNINADVYKALLAATDTQLEVKSNAAVGSATALSHVASAAISALHTRAEMSTQISS